MDLEQKQNIFKRISEQFGPAILRTCRGFAREYNDRKDLQQEVWLNIWTGLDRINNINFLPTWTYRVTRNTAINYLRKKKINDNRILSDLDRYEIWDNSNNEESEIAYTDNWSIFSEAIGQLGQKDRIIIECYLKRHSYTYIAAKTGFTETNVRVRLHRSKEKIRSIIEQRVNLN